MKTLDHAIELTPGFKPTDCKTYPLSQQEQKDLQEFIDENLRTGCIRPSKSPMASPFFFVKKKDGNFALHKIIESLTNLTIKNRYPLPLISELLISFLRKGFTKMDVRWDTTIFTSRKAMNGKLHSTPIKGYSNRLHVLRLTNSPATFQSFMNHIFHDLIMQGHVAVIWMTYSSSPTTINNMHQIVKQVLQILLIRPFPQTGKMCIPRIRSRIPGSSLDTIKCIWILQNILRSTIGHTNKEKELQRFLGFVIFIDDSYSITLTSQNLLLSSLEMSLGHDRNKNKPHFNNLSLQ